MRFLQLSAAYVAELTEWVHGLAIPEVGQVAKGFVRRQVGVDDRARDFVSAVDDDCRGLNPHLADQRVPRTD